MEKQIIVKQQMKQLEVHHSLPVQEELPIEQTLNQTKDSINYRKSMKLNVPALALQKCQGFSGQQCPDIRFTPQNSLIFASGGVVVQQDLKTKGQVLLQGHLQQVQCLEISKNGRFIASAAEGPNAQIKIWDRQDYLCVFSWVTFES